MKIIIAKKINMHCSFVWRVAILPCKNSLRIILGKNPPVCDHRWAWRKLDTGYYFIHAGIAAITIRVGERASMIDNGMYHQLVVGPIVLGMH